MGFSRQKYWSGLPFSSPGDLLSPGIEPAILYHWATGASLMVLLLLLKFVYNNSLQGNTGLPCGSYGKESAYNAGDLGLIPLLGRTPGGGNGNPLQYSCLENSIGRGAWWATVHGVTKSQTQLCHLQTVTVLLLLFQFRFLLFLFPSDCCSYNFQNYIE